LRGSLLLLDVVLREPKSELGCCNKHDHYRKAGRGAARGDMPNRGAKAGQDGEVPDTPD
jgi:hypothetical protein